MRSTAIRTIVPDTPEAANPDLVKVFRKVETLAGPAAVTPPAPVRARARFTSVPDLKREADGLEPARVPYPYD